MKILIFLNKIFQISGYKGISSTTWSHKPFDWKVHDAFPAKIMMKSRQLPPRNEIFSQYAQCYLITNSSKSDILTYNKWPFIKYDINQWGGGLPKEDFTFNKLFLKWIFYCHLWSWVWISLDAIFLFRKLFWKIESKFAKNLEKLNLHKFLETANCLSK